MISNTVVDGAVNQRVTNDAQTKVLEADSLQMADLPTS